MNDASRSEKSVNGAIRKNRWPLGKAYRQSNELIDKGQRRAFRFLWFFLAEKSVAKEVRFQQLLVSRFLSDAGQQALTYGILIDLFRSGGSTFDAALLAAAALLPPALLGMRGGAVADALPKRVALAGIYNLQALLCFTAPTVVGTDLMAMILLLLAINTLGQVSQPTESSILPLVMTEAQLASGAALISFAASLGTAFGTGLLAPVVVRAFGVEPVIYLSGFLLLLAAGRVFDLRRMGNPDSPAPLGIQKIPTSFRSTIEWLARQPAIATMIFVAALAGTAQLVLQMLAPRYVQSVLQVDPADAVYVFAPTATGLASALLLTPHLVKMLGERSSALIGFAILTAALAGLGAVHQLAVLDMVNPLRTLSYVGLGLDGSLRTAALLAVPAGFGLSLSTTSVLIYVNRRVPIALQVRTFAVQSSLKNSLAILPLLTAGAIASVVGVRPVLLAMPFVLLILAYGLIQLSRRFGGQSPRGNLDVLSTFWTGVETPSN